MRSKLNRILLGLLAGVLLAQFSFAQSKQWEPKRTWVFMVCLVEWKDAETWAPFPQENRKDIVLRETLKSRGVPANQIVYLQDEAATTATVERQFAEFLKKPAPGDWVFVYFEGHGHKDESDGTPYLITYDVNERNKGWKFGSVPDAIEANFRGSHAIIALDNCYSGAMADAVKAKPRKVSYGVLTSSLASEVSTGNWTFTESLISAFKGEPYVDLDRNGSVTFEELGKNSEQDMLFGEEQMATIVFTGNFDDQTVIGPASRATGTRVGERVEAKSMQAWYKGFVVDSKPGQQKIRYYGYQESDDEWVPDSRIRIPKPTQFAKGTKVEVEWQGKWWPAKVLNVKGGSHLITYDGYGKEWDEWVTSKRIRNLK